MKNSLPNGVDGRRKIFRGSMFILAVFLLAAATSFAQVRIGATTYSTLKDGFDAINSGSHTGAITINITADVTELELPMLVKSGTGSADYSSILIKPEGGSWTISGYTGSTVVYFDGASNVTIDGTTGANGRGLTFANTGLDVANSGGIVFSNGSDNINIKNINVHNAAPGIAYGILLDGITNATIDNCHLYQADKAILSQSGSSNLTITNNLIGGTDDEAIATTGIQIAATDGFVIRNNDINGISSENTGDNQGILVNASSTNGSISINKIHNIRNTGFASCAILAGNADTTYTCTLSISNNFIYDVNATDAVPAGISLKNIADVTVSHNTVNLYGDATTADYSTALLIGQYTNALKIKNNIFNNALASNGSSYAIYVDGDSSPFESINKNCYSAVSDNNNYVGYFGGSDYSTVGDWKDAVSDDDNSTDAMPVFIANDDLHLNGSSIGNAAFITDETITGVDFDGETRLAKTYMGADEVIPAIAFTQDLSAFAKPFCEGDNFNMAVTAGVTGYGDGIARTGGTFNYAWFKDGESYQEGTSEVNFENVNPDFNGDYYATAELGNVSIQSKTVNVLVEQPIVITSFTSDDIILCADNLNFNLGVDAVGTITGFQWQKQNPENPEEYIDIAGATSKDFVYSETVVDNSVAGLYRAKVYGPGNCGEAEIYTKPVNVRLVQPLSNAQAKANFDTEYVCEGSEITFSASAQGDITNWQWQRLEGGRFVDISLGESISAQSASLELSYVNTLQSGTYRAKATGYSTCGSSEIYSNEITVKVWAPFEVVRQPEPVAICNGGDVILTVIANGDVAKYQWFKDGVALDAKKYDGANSPILTMKNADFTASGVYTVELKATDCRGAVSATSKATLVNIMGPTIINEPPVSQGIQLGDVAVLTVGAHVEGSPDNNFIVGVQWYRGNMPLTDNDRITGSKSSILTIRDLQANDYGDDYHVVVTGYCGIAESKNVSLSVPPSAAIKEQPSNVPACEGASAVFTMDAEPINNATGLKFQWRFNGVNINNDARISGADSKVLTINNITTSDEGNYDVVITVEPNNAKVFTNTASLDVTSKPAITKDLAATMAVETGKELKLEVEATGDQPITYQWYKDGAEIAGETQASYTVASASESNEGVYTVKVTNGCGEVTSAQSAVTVTFAQMLNVNDAVKGGFELLPNKPNPFNSSTTITFFTPSESNVRLALCDIYGRELAVLINGKLAAGEHNVTLNADEYNLTSGVYNYTLTSGNNILSGRMVVVK